MDGNVSCMLLSYVSGSLRTLPKKLCAVWMATLEQGMITSTILERKCADRKRKRELSDFQKDHVRT